MKREILSKEIIARAWPNVQKSLDQWLPQNIHTNLAFSIVENFFSSHLGCCKSSLRLISFLLQFLPQEVTQGGLYD